MRILSVVIILCVLVCPAETNASDPRITDLTVSTNSVKLKWNQPESHFIIEKSLSLKDWYVSSECVASSKGTATNRTQFTISSDHAAFFRMKLGLQAAEVPDPSLNWLIRERIGSKLAPTNKLYDIELANLTELLYQYSPGIRDLSGMQYCTNLVILAVSGLSEVSNIDPIAHLTALTNLNIGGNPITNASALCGLTNLTVLHMWNCGIDEDELKWLSSLKEIEILSLQFNQISELTALTNLSRLTELNIENNSISNLQPLVALSNLVSLNAGWNAITDIEPLAELLHLSELNLSVNPLPGIDPIAGLNRLRRLELYQSQVTNVAPLSGLTNLTYLYVGWNRVSDTTPLASLQKLQYLNLSSNDISDSAMGPIGSLTNLTELYLWENDITNVSSLTTLTNMIWLNLGKNNVSNTSPFSAMTRLQYLDLRQNDLLNVEFLKGNTNLHWLHLEQNNISNLSPLIRNAQSGGLGPGDTVYLSGNPITDTNSIQSLKDDYGVTVVWP